jgi:hypothetical protein
MWYFEWSISNAPSMEGSACELNFLFVLDVLSRWLGEVESWGGCSLQAKKTP